MASLPFRALTLLVLTIAVGGCATAPGQQKSWIDGQGGAIAGSFQERATRITANLATCCTTGTRISVAVFNSSALAAYSWSDGRIFLSRGLMDHLDDQELSAVIAHEMGHLLGAGHIHTLASLKGCTGQFDVEKRADAIGVQILNARGIPPSAMIRMLTKVAASDSLPPPVRAAINSRITLLAASHPG
jgi:Zn-dependent protease with chaperone function